MNKITVVIPTYNNIYGLNYLLNYFKNKPYKIAIVDNNLKVKKLESWKVYKVGELVYLPQEKNLGFAKGINLGAKYADTEWMVILNDDIEFQVKSSKLKVKNYSLKSKNFKIFDYLISFAEENSFDAVSPVLINPNGEIENVGYRILPIGKIKLIKELTGWRVNELDGITAACLLIKTKVFKNLGGFDESFFAYLEDVEFFIRFKKAGFRFGIVPVGVLHRNMATSETMESLKARQDMINWWRLYFKHPDKFKFGLKFLIERLRNVSGYIKKFLNG